MVQGASQILSRGTRGSFDDFLERENCDGLWMEAKAEPRKAMVMHDQRDMSKCDENSTRILTKH